MVYSGPFINSIFQIGDDNKEPVSVQSGSVAVTVSYNGTSIGSIVGATPLVVLSHQFNRADNGILNSITNRISLTGKIYDRSATATDITNILSKENQLKNLFKDCPIGKLEIKCGSTVALAATGVRLLSYTTDPSPDYLTRSLGYNIDLEYYEKQSSTSHMVVTTSDSWSIEPIEEYTYEDFATSIAARTESDNPNDGSASTSSITTRTIPQFRVSHRVSAKGAMPNDDCTNEDAYFAAYREAQKWVKDRLDVPWNSNNDKGPFIGSYGTIPPNAGLWLFNHVRSTNFSVTDATYEVVDTWLAMPSGISYVEDYTIEINGDDKNIKTIKVQGTIKGLEIKAESLIKGDTSLVPDTSGKIDLASNLTANKSGGSFSFPDTNNSSSVQSNKYTNALNAWHSGVKPLLYRRASAGLNRIRYASAINPKNYLRENPPEQPIYRMDSFLNINPVTSSESHDPKRGIITYGYEFNNKYTVLSGVLSESVSINDTGPADVVAEIFVLGRKLGPVLQSLGAKTSSKKDVTIEVTVIPPTSIAQYHMNSTDCPLYFKGTIYSQIDSLIEGLKPFGTNDTSVVVAAGPTQGQVYVEKDNQSWNPVEGRYTRSVSWVYQHCNNNNFYLDH